MDYRQTLGSSISGRDRQQPPIKVKNITTLQSNQKQTIQDKRSNSRRSTINSKKKQEALISITRQDIRTKYFTDYRQSLGSSISGRDRQQPPIKMKKHHDITRQSKTNYSK